jgi:hypothetical protein
VGVGAGGGEGERERERGEYCSGTEDVEETHVLGSKVRGSLCG